MDGQQVVQQRGPPGLGTLQDPIEYFGVIRHTQPRTLTDAQSRVMRKIVGDHICFGRSLYAGDA
ncbi:MAG: hypothetical protein IPL32_00010 [Chloracidobacterium sp.]|nr:hypothetical protein [Chloracidobacterium sp.]